MANNDERPRSTNRGFAAMDSEQQRAIARKGGEAVSANRQHMSEIGRKGGEASRGGHRNANRDNNLSLGSARTNDMSDSANSTMFGDNRGSNR